MLARCISFIYYDCTAVCLLVMANESDFGKQICNLCAKTCNVCEDECEKHSYIEH